MRPGLPLFVALNVPSWTAIRHLAPDSACVHVDGVTAVMNLGQAKGDTEVAPEPRGDEARLVLLTAPLVQHQEIREIPDDAVLILQIVGKADTAAVDGVRGHVISHRAHPQVGVRVALATIYLRKREAIETSLVSEVPGLGEEGFPLGRGQTLIVPLCAGGLATVVKEAIIVVCMLQR